MKLVKRLYWLLKAFAANVLYGFPSQKLVLIGVTGTDGKTSTTSLIYHVLKKLNKKVAYITTVEAHIGTEKYDTGFHVTTPSALFIQKMLKKAVKSGIQYFVLETTSHGIDQLRVWGCRFKLGVLTNITKEHLDYHKTYEQYAQTKMRLINNAQIGVVNAEPSTFYRYRHLIRNKNIWTTAISKKADYRYGELEDKGLSTPFVGFEKENVLLAYAACRLLGLSDKRIIEALSSFQRIKGRFDFFTKNGKNFLIDFAHTPHAFKKLFEAVQASITYGRIIHVFGCAGLRDRQKRPTMGAISARNADIIIVTEEDYRTEDINTIFTEIKVGIKKIKTHTRDKTYFFIPSRQEAINKAIALADTNDIIVLTGKAHEKSLARGKKEYAWDEYEAVERAVSAIVSP